MPSIKRTFARKAAKSTARHSVHGTASKLQREPFRTAILLAVGALLGAFAGWTVGRGSGSGAAPSAG